MNSRLAKKIRRRALFYTASVAAVAGGTVATPQKALLRRGEVMQLLGVSSAAVTQLVQDGILRTVPQRM